MLSLSSRQLYLLICGCLYFFGLFFELSSLCCRTSLSIRTVRLFVFVSAICMLYVGLPLCASLRVFASVFGIPSLLMSGTVRVFAIRQMCVLCIGIAGVLYITSLSLGFSMLVFSDFSTPASCLLEPECVSSCVSLHVHPSACVSTCFSVCHLRDL